jgi:hypothetical protein
MPKSRTLAPAGVSMMFAGLMSRCTACSACAAARAAATSAQIRTAMRQSKSPAPRCSLSVCPSTSSMTMYGTSRPGDSDVPKSCTPATFGWASRAADRASVRTRSTPLTSPRVPSVAGAMILTATGRSSTWSWPRHTSDMPPTPMRCWS